MKKVRAITQPRIRHGEYVITDKDWTPVRNADADNLEKAGLVEVQPEEVEKTEEETKPETKKESNQASSRTTKEEKATKTTKSK